ncbi:hypothetical protein [Brazilian marseillevirus]|uniref:hypothetical protein n=1 Tax=Brazilian marseillevirus TaxID=1813599 RepID=UPI00078638FD|nr:hypothetical protein A3303_gp023 [Brazilian marseillevirus]AMQ10531.1 hypothetical protein [Brazilian marseillevirus]
MNTKGHVYIVSDKSYPKDVYKIGMSKDIQQKLRSYGKDRRIHKLAEVPDCTSMGKALLAAFSKSFKIFRGKKMFKGKLREMKETFEEVCFPENYPSEVLTQEGYDAGPVVEDARSSSKGEGHISLLVGEGYRTSIHRIGRFCFVDNFGLIEDNEWLLGDYHEHVAIDFLYKDAFFELLGTFPGGGFMCLAQEWSRYVPSEKPLICPIDSDIRKDYFGDDKMEGYDEEVKYILSKLRESYPCEFAEYLYEDALLHSRSFGDKFDLKTYVQGKTLKETVALKSEPVHALKRAYAAYMFRKQNWFGLLPLIKQRCGENTDVTTHVFIAPEITLWGPPNHNKWDGANTMYGYNRFSGRNPDGFMDCYGVFDSYFVDIVVHYENTHIPVFLPMTEFLKSEKTRVKQDPTKIAPVFVSFFDSSKPGSKQMLLETSREVAKAVYLVDINDCIIPKEGYRQIKLYTLFEGWTEKDREEYKRRTKREIRDLRIEMGI